jgi:hypothetical protein
MRFLQTYNINIDDAKVFFLIIMKLLLYHGSTVPDKMLQTVSQKNVLSKTQFL